MILLLLLLLLSQLYLWASSIWVRFLRMWLFFNPTIEVVTFHFCGYNYDNLDDDDDDDNDNCSCVTSTNYCKGQDMALGKDSMLYSLLQSSHIPSIILGGEGGPRGCGKVSGIIVITILMIIRAMLLLLTTVSVRTRLWARTACSTLLSSDHIPSVILWGLPWWDKVAGFILLVLLIIVIQFIMMVLMIIIMLLLPQLLISTASKAKVNSDVAVIVLKVMMRMGVYWAEV